MKNAPMSQQVEALRRSAGKRYFAYFMQQGTGKSYTLLSDAERAYAAGKIDAVLIIAPNGVHTNWVKREIPEHMDCPHIARVWRTNMSQRRRRQVEELLRPRDRGEVAPLRILSVSYDSLSSKETRTFIARFLNCTRAMAAIDESQYIKNGTAARTKHVLELKSSFVARRLLSGTPFDKPWDIFSQAEFLESGLLGTDSYRAFCAEYAVLADWRNPVTDSDWALKKQVERHPRMAHAIIVAKDDATGLPMYRNLDRLNELIQPWSYRVLKRDCLDLPEKIYQQVYFELSARQQEAYTLMEEELRIALDDGTLTPVNALASLVKLQQITSGYVMVPAGPGRPEPELQYVGDENPRLAALLTAIEPMAGRKVIVWARFREEIAAVSAALRAAGRSVVEYHGGVKDAARDAAIDAIQKGNADAIVMNQQAGGTGITLTAAEFTVYYSNYYSLLRRLQSEDRNHRIGTHGDVVYIDLIAENTIDESIAKALQQKADLAATILGDRQLRVPNGLDE